MTRLHDAFVGLADDAPEVRVPDGFYRRVRRRRRTKLGAAALAVFAALTLCVPFAPFAGSPDRSAGVPGEGSGLPVELHEAPWYTATYRDDPIGPASVVLSGDVPQGDSEDYEWPWWRPGYTVHPTVVVGLNENSYRVMRGSDDGVGHHLSPNGRYLLVGDRQVLDLTDGSVRQVGTGEIPTATTGIWSVDGTRILYVSDRTTTVVAFPSGERVARFVHQEQVPPDWDVALSADASRLAVDSNQLVTAFGPDGRQLWRLAEEQGGPLGRVRLGGRAAWLPDGRLTVFARTELTCESCSYYVPGTWRMTFLDGGTGREVAGREYPVLRSAVNVEVIAWRGDVAYAVVTWFSGSEDDSLGRIELVRLRPGAVEPESILRAPAGITGIEVAVDFVEARQAAATPGFGLNVREVAGQLVTWTLCLSPFLLLVFVVVRRWLRARRRRRIVERR